MNVTGRKLLNIDARNNDAITLANPYGSAPHVSEPAETQGESPSFREVPKSRKRYRSLKPQDRSRRPKPCGSTGKES